MATHHGGVLLKLRKVNVQGFDMERHIQPSLGKECLYLACLEGIAGHKSHRLACRDGPGRGISTRHIRARPGRESDV